MTPQRKKHDTKQYIRYRFWKMRASNTQIQNFKIPMRQWLNHSSKRTQTFTCIDINVTHTHIGIYVLPFHSVCGVCGVYGLQNLYAYIERTNHTMRSGQHNIHYIYLFYCTFFVFALYIYSYMFNSSYSVYVFIYCTRGSKKKNSIARTVHFSKSYDLRHMNISEWMFAWLLTTYRNRTIIQLRMLLPIPYNICKNID